TPGAVGSHFMLRRPGSSWGFDALTGPSYKKVVYREYNEGFTQAKTHPLSSGLLGPTLRGQEGDTIIVTFKNMADHPCSLHPHGIAYGKQSEGSLYFDNTSLCEKEDDVILPGKEHTYQWEVTSEVTPTAADPPCITYTYLSHFDIVKDYNTGLIGPMLICKKGSLDDSGNQLHFHQEAVLLFGVFDENKSWYTTGGPEQPHKVKYTINGYTNGSVPDLDICAHSKVSWHLLGMSSEPELFSVHFNGQALVHDGHKTSSVGIISGTATSASMNGIHPGRWLISSHISRHLEAGLHGYFNIKTCDEYTAPKRRLTIQQKQESQVWTYYIAAEEVIWDYAPNMPENMDGDFRSKYLKQGPQRIGKKYKKAVFTQYKDGTFKERAEDKQRKKELGILGPVIRAQIRDVIKIVFKNKATRPYSIYPHGLTIDKAAEGANYPAEGNQTHGIQPGENYTYTWSVSEEDTPTDSDPRCLTRMYHSAVDTPRDIASGLVGPLLICKSQSLNKKNVQLKADKEQHAMFTVFDENKSWYHDENINTYCSDPRRVKRDDPEFYKSNVMHTINGYVYESGQELGFCNGEIVTWHVSSVGEQDYIQTATFYGHTFELKNREEDMLSLFPMTGETITMNMLNIGIWLLASLNSHDSTKGMRVKFKDLECFRDYVMEYDYESEKFTVWKPASISDIKKEEPKQTNPTMVDEDTDNYAEQFGLRTFKNVSDDFEHIDLSILDFDDGFLPTIEAKAPAPSDELDKSHNAIFGSLNQIHGLSAKEAGLEKRKSSNKVLNESTEEPLLDMTSIFDSKPEVVSNNDTDSISSHFPVVERKVGSASTKSVNEMESVSTNVTLDIEINTNTVENDSSSLETDSVSAYTTHEENVSSSLETASVSVNTTQEENVSSSLETDSVSVNTTHSSVIETNITHTMNETHIFPTNTSITSSDAPVGDRNITMEGDSPSLNSSESNIMLSNQTLVNKTVIQEEANTKNNTDLADGDRDSSGHVFIYHVPIPDSLSNSSETQTEEDFVLLNGGLPSEVLTDYKTVEEYNVSPMDMSEEIGELTENTTRIQELNSTKVNYTGEMTTSFKKAVFRKYLDSTFSIRDIRGEMDEHLGILGPVIKAEVDQTVMVFFRNLASRPYSLHANGVKYLKQMEGLSYDDQSPYWYKQDDAVQPNSTFIYMWTINSKSGPQNNESDCRTWTYYSAVNPERDINSGLIGPLLVCRKGTLDQKPLGRREFVLLFMTFDESKKNCLSSAFFYLHYFNSINGIIYSLKGLRMYTNQLAKWHLINMGSPKDLHSVHFHGQTFINKELKDHRQGVYPLLPGGFATLEMLPSKPGLWQLESEVGLSQQRGMQTLFLVLDNVCDHPLGVISGTVKDEHMSASDSRERTAHSEILMTSYLKRLYPVFQVDFQRPVVISKVATQGAKQFLSHNFVLNYTISYSTDKKKWTFYKGDSDTVRKTFEGNSEAYDTKENIFFPPLIGRYVRLYPLHSYNYPTVRLEYYGCELDGCSVPLGMESGLIKDAQITASSVASNWYSGQWHPWYARLNKLGTVNAWQAKNNDMQPWIQVELKDIKKITGIITQGAKSFGNEMFVTAYTLEYSEDSKRWTKYTEDEDYEQKTFRGNTDNNGQVKNYIYPPIFSKFIRIIPKQWQKSITMRIELLGCDFE
uniref:ferroxidase n=1 Tax=Cyprinus carpio carpio TaxID=630221 RepID=A0A8C1F5I5_CYPCA